jgi:hypothetical protein
MTSSPGKVTAGHEAESPYGFPGAVVFGQGGQVFMEFLGPAGGLNPGDSVVDDFAASGLRRVAKLAGADSTRALGIAVTLSAAAGDPVWVCVLGEAFTVANAAIAAGANIANAAVAGKVKTAAAGGGATNLGKAMTLAAADGDRIIAFVRPC